MDGEYQVEGAELRLPSFAYMSLEAGLVHRLWPRTRRNAVLSGFDPTKPRLLERPSTAAFLMRRDVFEKLGGFDERFRPAWFEDIDLCKRIIDGGGTIHYVPDAVITHVGRSTIPLFSTISVLAMWDANRLRYTRKHFSPWQAAVMRGLTIFGTLLRGAVRAVNPRTAKSLPGHLRLAWRMARYSDESKWYA
jgi:GT2 family glycosyltransferase